MKHFIAMAGMRGCLPNYCDVYFSKAWAVMTLCDLHEKGHYSNFAKELRKYGFAELNLAQDGNEYAEVSECNCADPWIHSDDPQSVKDYMEELRLDKAVKALQKLVGSMDADNVIAKHLDLRVYEWSGGYEIQYFPNGLSRWMADGVDMFTEETEDGMVSVSPGTERFNQAMQQALEIGYYDYMEAYFPDIED